MDWTGRFVGLAGLDPGARARLVAEARVVSAPEGTVLFRPGARPEALLLLLEGTVRVQHLSEGGREIVLYRIDAGESCVLTTACLMADEAYSAEGIAETEVRAAAIPRTLSEALLAQSDAFRRFVFAAYGRRIADLFLTIDDIAFRRIDIRLAERLVRLSREGVVRATHAQLASELGTAREVISRQLAEFQRRGWVALARGEVRVLDEPALTALAMA